MNHEPMLQEPQDAGPQEAVLPPTSTYAAQGTAGAYRRRPIVVRDPKTGETRVIQGGHQRGASVGVGVTYGNGAARGGYRGMDDTEFEDAPVVKIVSGYRGRQIVVRDPAKRGATDINPQHVAGGPLGVRGGGVRKTNYYDRRGPRDTSYSPERYGDKRSGRGAPYYEDDEEDRRMYGRGRDQYDGSQMVAAHGYGDSRYDRDYYRNANAGHNGAPAHDDLTGKVVYVDNLSDDVTTRGLADLFSMVGTVKELRLLYDRQGNPNGSADIVFQHRADAEEAIKSLHNVPLNNRPMRLSMGNGL